MSFGELGLTWQWHNSRTICWFTRIKAINGGIIALTC